MTVTLPTPAELLPLGIPDTGILIDGRRLAGGPGLPVRDRYTQAPVAEVAQATREQVMLAGRVARASVRLSPPPYERARILGRVAELLGLQRQAWTDLIVTEAGFPRADAAGEIDRALDTLQLCAEEAKRIGGEVVPLDGNPGQQHRLGFTLRTPVGVVCAITPFNSPLNAVLHKLGPALAAGNAVVFKPSGFTPLSASLLCDTFLAAGLPPGLLSLVHGDAQVGQWLLECPDIDFYTFTGSTRVGEAIQAGAGLRRTQLELGSIACTLVCADADLDLALPKIVRASFRKAGQVCTSVQRLYVERSLAEAVRERLAAAARALPAGDPRHEATVVGPLITPASAARAMGWVEEAVAGGARVHAGGTCSGAVMAPTVLAGVRPGMKVLDEEIFAPVVCVLAFDTLEQAIEDINGTRFGLASGIFTQRIDRAFHAARALKVGSVYINETSSARVDGMPYGGLKDSGHGKEGPRYAIRDMMDEKVVTVSLPGL
ncbi:aldehyde dehydrogenase family protein [Ramlibacter sp. MAHUQ-53]|uniref:aldehyde dehydrogenase family protein n=1 Tax=unclassified Ramlibacter TaxID=2617605 RepID=UPI00362F5F49